MGQSQIRCQMSCSEHTTSLKHKSILLLVSAAALIDGDKRVLLAQRPASYKLGPVWELPGGKIEADETPEGCLVRELREELGITIFTGCLHPITFASHAYADFHLLMPVYAVRQWQGIPQPIEHANLAWVRPADFHKYPMPPADLPVMQVIADYLN